MTTWLRARLLIDRVAALVLLVLASPAIIVSALLVRRHDGGPGLIAVPRVGRHGQTIQMWKLRSMRAEGSDGMAGGAALTSAGDARITPIGAKLRARHLDELPQLYNVVRGDMCLLGPRPEAPPLVDFEDPAWVAVLTVPPGIAGPTQLVVGDWEREIITADPDGDAYREEVLPVKLAIDAWYVRSASVGLDWLVMVSLLRTLLSGDPEGRLRARVAKDVPQVQRVIGPVPR